MIVGLIENCPDDISLSDTELFARMILYADERC